MVKNNLVDVEISMEARVLSYSEKPSGVTDTFICCFIRMQEAQLDMTSNIEAKEGKRGQSDCIQWTYSRENYGYNRTNEYNKRKSKKLVHNFRYVLQ